MQFQWKREWTVVGIVSFGLGAGIGYAASIYQKRSERKITEAIDEMGADVYFLKEAFQEKTTSILEANWDIIRMLTQEDPTPPDEDSDEIPEEVLEEPDEQLPITVLGVSIGDIMIPKHERTSVFAESDDETDDWDYEEEMKTRTEDAPYIIHTDEYFDNEKHYGHSTLTYYKGDDVLVDDKELPIYNPIVVVGEGNLKFGHGSNDESIVYIRNDRLDAEYEVIVDHGYYEVEVLGTELGDRLSVEKNIIHKLRPD